MRARMVMTQSRGYSVDRLVLSRWSRHVPTTPVAGEPPLVIFRTTWFNPLVGLFSCSFLLPIIVYYFWLGGPFEGTDRKIFIEIIVILSVCQIAGLVTFVTTPRIVMAADNWLLVRRPFYENWVRLDDLRSVGRPPLLFWLRLRDRNGGSVTLLYYEPLNHPLLWELVRPHLNPWMKPRPSTWWMRRLVKLLDVRVSMKNELNSPDDGKYGMPQELALDDDGTFAKHLRDLARYTRSD